MRSFFILLKKELLTTFTSFGYYMLLAVVSSITSFLFFSRLKANGFSVEAALYNSSSWLFGLTVALTPLLTMRLLAEEKRSGSLELLMTAPVGDFQVVFAKFVSSILVFATFMAPAWISHVVLGVFFEAPIDWGQLSATTLGVVSAALVFLAIGTLASAVSTVQLWSALLAFLGNLLVLALGEFGRLFEDGSTGAQVLAYVDLNRHMSTAVLGVVDLRHIVFQMSVTALLVYWTTRVVETRKWR